MLPLWKTQHIKFKWFVQGNSSSDRVKTRPQCTKWRIRKYAQPVRCDGHTTRPRFCWYDRELCSLLPGSLDWRGLGENRYMYMYGWVALLVPETILTLLFDYLLVAQSCPTLCNPMDCSLPGSLSMEFSRQEYWCRYSFLQGIFSTQGFTIWVIRKVPVYTPV